MPATRTAQQTDRVAVAVVLLPVIPERGLPPGKMRILVGEDGDNGCEILAWRFEFRTGLVTGVPHEETLADGDVVLGSRQGYLEEVLVNRVGPAVEQLCAHRPDGVSRLAFQALCCIRNAWLRLHEGPALAELLHHKELQGPPQSTALGEVVGDGWCVDRDAVRVSWITE